MIVQLEVNKRSSVPVNAETLVTGRLRFTKPPVFHVPVRFDVVA